MCGHLGFAFNKPHPNTPAMMAAMGIFMDMRGGHSWGYWADNLPIMKGMGKISEEHPAVNWAQSKRVIAHCRWATHGEKKAENSHPFVQGKVIGAHNGVIINHDELNKELDRDFEVDSQHIFQHLDEGRDMRELQGYGTIVWTHMDDLETINFCKFNNGSFAVAEVWEGEVEKTPFLGTVWASTDLALKVGLTQAGFGWKEIVVKEDYKHSIRDCKVFIDESVKIDIKWASRFTKPKTEVVGSGNSTLPFQSSPEASYSGPVRYGHYAHRAGTYVSQATETAEENDEAWANRLVEIAEARHRAQPKAELVQVGKDIDEIVRSVWRGTGKFYHKGKCFSCGDIEEVVVSKELNIRMCYDCTFEWDDMNSDPQIPDELIRKSFVEEVAARRRVPVQVVWVGIEKAKQDAPDVIQGRFEVLETSDGPVVGSYVQTAERVN